MKKESKFQIIKITLFLLIIISLITINSINKNKLATITDDKEILDNQVLEEDIISIEDLKGTCPRGRSCTTPSCSLFSDLNKNGMCDRGEK